MDGARVEVTSGWGRLSVRRGVSFGGRVCALHQQHKIKGNIIHIYS